MGHKVNPLNFRLGSSTDWKQQVKDPLLANIFITRFVRSILLSESGSYSNMFVKRRLKDHAIINSKILKKLPKEEKPSSEKAIMLLNAKRRTLKNPFLRKEFILSHSNLSNMPTTNLAIFMLDGKAEKYRSKKKLPLNYFSFLSNRSYKKKYKKNFFYKKRMLYKKRTSKKKYLLVSKRYFKFFYKKFKKKNRKIRKLYILKYRRNIKRKIRTRIANRFKKTNGKKGKKKKRIQRKFPIWLLTNHLTVHKRKHKFTNILKNTRILKFLIRYAKYYKGLSLKKRILLLNLIISTGISLLVIMKKKIISKRLSIFIMMCYMNLLSFKYKHFAYNKKLFKSRFIFFSFFNKLIFMALKKISFLPVNNKMIIRYYGLHQKNINAQFLVNYTLIKLGQYFRLYEIINPIMRRLKKLSYVRGFRLVISGRLTRKERAAFIVKSFKTMPLSTINQRIDYASDFKIMKFGVVGIKIYLLLDKTPPYYYFFEFINRI